MVLGDRQDMALYVIEDLGCDVAPGYRGILEPQPQRTRAVAPETLELALIPGVAFDLRGEPRVWHRALRSITQSTTTGDPDGGSGFDFQVIPRLPFQPHDMLLEAIVTEQSHHLGNILYAG